MLNIGIRAAHAAGDHIVKYVDRIPDLTVNSKGRNDFVSEVDRQAEAIIIDTILKAYPKHRILAEESGHHGAGKSEFQWIIDPLDGTTNFLHGFPQFAVSIALKYRNVLDQAVVYDPLRQELFTASKGGGAYLNRRRIRVSKQLTLQGALLGTGFPFGDNHNLERFITALRAVFASTAGLRRAGAASLDLAYVGCGRLDGFWEYGLQPWDMAAGALIILEAGGFVSDINGAESYLESGNILCGNPGVYREMLDLINNPEP
jgi:myo-inositol-1(or 4)-monophosphatase